MPLFGAAFFLVIAMRYLIFFLFFYSSFLFSQTPPSPQCTGLVGSPNACGFPPQVGASILSERIAACTNAGNKLISDGVCPEDSHGKGTPMFKCYQQCACPSGFKLNTIVNDQGHSITSCIPDEPVTEDGDNCPSGYPKVNGECPVCPSGFNPDGTCVGSSCPDGQITQGYVNGYAVCQGQCTDPNQSWGSVNGVEGCYGPRSCPNGGSYGSVNGVPGCYGGNSGGNSSGGAGGSSGSNTSGGAGGSSGSNTSAGGGNNGGGGSGGGGGGNNSVGEDYPDQVACPEGYVKSGTKCVTENKGDCPANYHQVVISRDPFLFWCVPDDPPQSSSASSQNSSQPSSHSASSQNSSRSNSSTNGSSGSNTSSGSGGNGGGGSGAGSGECDPTSSSYLSCIADGDEFVEGQKGSFDAELAKQEQQQLEQQIKQKVTDIKSQIAEQMGGSISGSGSITDYCKIINGIDVCFGFAKFSAYLPLIGQAIFLVACVFSFYVILGR